MTDQTGTLQERARYLAKVGDPFNSSFMCELANALDAKDALLAEAREALEATEAQLAALHRGAMPPMSFQKTLHAIRSTLAKIKAKTPI